MKKEQLYEVLGDINENYINDAHKTAKKKSHPVWMKWGAMAACLCLVVVGAFIAPNLIGNQNVEQPMGQGFFNAVVLEIENETVIVECIESLQGEIFVGSKVQISTDTVSSETVPKLDVGDNIRVLYIGKTTEGNTVVLKDTISIFLLDEKGEPIAHPAE